MKKTKLTPPSDRATMRRGRLTIPKAVRKATNLPEEATFVVEPIGDGFLLLPPQGEAYPPGDDPGDVTLANVLRGTDAAGRQRVRELHQAGERFRQGVKDAGLTTKDLVDGLDAQGERYTDEVYGNK